MPVSVQTKTAIRLLVLCVFLGIFYTTFSPSVLRLWGAILQGPWPEHWLDFINTKRINSIDKIGKSNSYGWTRV